VGKLNLLLTAGLLVIAGVLARSADNPARGKILFLRCASCHDVSPSQTAKIGPNLYGVVGRKVASQDGYAYSPALRAQAFVWDEAHLDQWLTNPNAVAPGTAMAFAGIADPADRRAIITYLENQRGSSPP
jgi:cytochrome c